jgi:HNH endonuclease/AP2 domain
MKPAPPLVSADVLRSRIHYDPDTGRFTWKVKPAGNVSIGQRAGGVNNEGYLQIRIFGVMHKAHRLAWLYVTGEWPPSEIDHANGDISDNRFANLRLASRAQNCQNRALRKDSGTGIKGVGFNKRSGKWTAYVRANNKVHHLGTFASKEAAAEAREAAAKKLHGDFAFEERALDHSR